jgi:alpha-tubulin suppressor-like RCC1 family protein
MKSKLSTNLCLALPGSLACVLILAGGLFYAENLCAMPRSPWPPYPEKAPLYQETFDENYFAGERNSELLIAGIGTLEESWSGYALQRTGDVIPFVVPAVYPTGQTNVSCDTGGDSFRFWIRPYWSSESVTNGSGPGATATVLELDAVSGGESALAWSLQISADGNTLGLFAETGSGLQEVLQAPIAWQAGQSHCLVLDYGPYGTMFYVDGSVAAQGAGLPSIPVSVGQLVIGSTLAGTSTAGADFDEFYSFNRLLTASDVGLYYQWYSGQAALGPISYGEEHRHHHHTLASSAELTLVYDPDRDGGCPTGGPVYITNFSAALLTNGTTTVSFDIQGGTNGVFYDLYYTTNLESTFSASGWTWLGQVLTCNTYIFSNQPPNAAFYLLAPFELTVVVAWGDNTYGECNVPAGLTNATAVAAGWDFSLALLADGKVLAWGDNSHDETNVPAGLTNVTAIAAGQDHGLALLANGAVTNWGYYPFVYGYYYSVTNSDYVSPPPSSNVVAIVAGEEFDIALLSNGTFVVWGLIGSYDSLVPTNVTGGVAAVSCGVENNVVLLTNGTVVAWGGLDLFGENNVPANLTNAVAIATAPNYSLALRADGTVGAWGYDGGEGYESGPTNVPQGLSNVVAIAAGDWQSLALQADGTIVEWGEYTNVPSGLRGVKAISTGYDHSLAIYSDQLSPLILGQPSSTFSLTDGTFDFLVQAEGLGILQYQWQFDGRDIFGATNSSLTITDAQAADQGTYDVVLTTPFGSVTSSNAVFTLVLPPQITATNPAAPSTNWIVANTTLSATVLAAGQSQYPLTYQWQLNGSNLSGASTSNYTVSVNAGADGEFTMQVTNAAGRTTVSWDVLLALPGMVEAWGADGSGECDRPVGLTNVAAIAAGEYQSIAVTNGTVVQWGQYSDGGSFYPVTNNSVATPAPGSNVVAVAAGRGHAIALLTNNSVVTWGLTNDPGNTMPTNLNLTNLSAVACGWGFNLALSSDGKVFAWGDNSYFQTDVPSDLTNATAIAAGRYHSLALRADGKLEAWGDTNYGLANIPVGLSNVVAIAAGGEHNLALTSDGMVVAWGNTNFGQTNVPAGMSNVMAIAAGDAHSLALINDGTLVAWGDNTYGQTNVISQGSGVVVKLIAAGGFHSMAAIYSPLVQYPVDVSKDLLLIYNTNSLDSSNVCQYYLTHRPMVSNANVLGIGVTTNDIILPADFATNFQPQVQMWLSNNPTKRPLYVILFQDIPAEVNSDTNEQTCCGDPSVQYQLHYSTAPEWQPFITAINMNGLSDTNNFNSSDGTTDCIAYINKLTNMASFGNNSPGQLFISASASGYGNTNWYFDDAQGPSTYPALAFQAMGGVESNGVPTDEVTYEPFTSEIRITQGTNVAGYFSWGIHEGFTNTYPIDGEVVFSGNSGWYIIETGESFNGQRGTSQGNFLEWYATNAFGGTNYSNTPVGAVSNVQEPQAYGINNPSLYFGDWAAGRIFAYCAWNSFTSVNQTYSQYLQVIGDPFTKQ